MRRQSASGDRPGERALIRGRRFLQQKFSRREQQCPHETRLWAGITERRVLDGGPIPARRTGDAAGRGAEAVLCGSALVARAAPTREPEPPEALSGSAGWSTLRLL